MAVVVTPAYPREAANGVIFTGNPLDKRDKRFFVNVQAGDASVVNPDPTIIPEKDLLQIEEGEVKRIYRVRPSSLVAPGAYVLTDDQLRRLGSTIASLASCFPLDAQGFDPERVILDFEFKFTASNQLVIKQVRPFLVKEELPSGPVFLLSIPEGASFEGVNLYERSLDTEEKLLSFGRFRPGTYRIPVTSEPTSVSFIDELYIGSPGRKAVFLQEGTFKVELSDPSNHTGPYNVTYRQLFQLQGRLYELVIDRLRFFDKSGGRTITFDEEYLSMTGDFLSGLHMYASPVDAPKDLEQRIFFGDAGYSALPLYHVAAEADSVHIELWYRLLRILEPTATGPANLIKAYISLEEGTQLVENYWRLVYSARIHNTEQKFRVILDPPLGEIACVDIYEPFENVIPGRVLLRDRSREVICTLTIRKWIMNGPFIRGDCNGDGKRNVSDAVTLLRYLFGNEQVNCLDALDIDDSGSINLADALRLLMYLFKEGPPPSEPNNSCEPDPTWQDHLDCRIYKPCGLF